MSFDDLRKKYAGLNAQQEPVVDPLAPWNAFDASLPDLMASAILPAAEDAKEFLAEQRRSPMIRQNDPIRKFGDGQTEEGLIRGVPKSLVTVSFKLAAVPGASYNDVLAHVVVASQYGIPALFIFATNPREIRYEQVDEKIQPEKDKTISREQVAEGLSRAIDWILTIHAKPRR